MHTFGCVSRCRNISHLNVKEQLKAYEQAKGRLFYGREGEEEVNSKIIYYLGHKITCPINHADLLLDTVGVTVEVKLDRHCII